MNCTEACSTDQTRDAHAGTTAVRTPEPIPVSDQPPPCAGSLSFHADEPSDLSQITLDDGTQLTVRFLFADTDADELPPEMAYDREERTPYSFCSRTDLDDETGYCHHRARFCDPSPGRSLSQDPIFFAGEDPNAYRYCQPRPEAAAPDDPARPRIESV